MLGCVPAGALVGALFRGGEDGPFVARPLAALAGGFLFAGVLSAGSAARNRTIEQYYFADPVVDELAGAIGRYGGAGRVLFSGFVLHELSNGHLAPLAPMTGQPLVASRPFHDRWRYTDVIPASYRARGDKGIEEFFDLQNVTAVIAHNRRWRDWLFSHPNYEMVWHGGPFFMFKRAAAEPSYFLDGDGAVLEQDTARLVLRVNSENATVKFNYFPFLQSSECRIGPRALDDLSFIRLEGCTPGHTVTIESVPAWRRLTGAS
jgi:hypothetical protein